LLASVEQASVQVAVKPRVVVLATGTELRAPGSPATAGSIPESNTFAVAALARQGGAHVTVAPSLPDDLDSTERAVRALLGECDVLVTIGGVSVGDHDWVKQALQRAAVSLDFWKVAIKPGKPLLWGRAGNARVLGLPGNPVSAQVTFCLFGLPLIRRMQGMQRVTPATRALRLAAPIQQAKGRRGFYRVRIDRDVATPLSGQSSGSVGSMAWADGLAIVPEDSSGVAEGQTVEVIAFVDL
jgi:molybdopterin molybdotransferase